MKIEDFTKLVATESEHVISRTIWPIPPGMLARAHGPGGLALADLISSHERRPEYRDMHFRHILGPPASHEAIADWQSKRPAHPLPSDLTALVMQINGIHLWANLDTGRSYTGLAPIEEWELARIKIYGPTADRTLIEEQYVVISYHQDGASFIVLDTQSGKYFLIDAAGPDNTSPVADNVGELLDWLWKNRLKPNG